MTTELSYRNEGANVYAQDGTLVCIAVDPLDAEILAGLLRWKVDVHPESTPEPDPWPTAPLIVATLNGRRELFTLRKDGGYESGISLVWPTGSNTLTNVVPVTVVPTAEWEALGKKVRGLDKDRTDKQRRVVVTRAAELLIEATNALGVSND